MLHALPRSFIQFKWGLWSTISKLAKLSAIINENLFWPVLEGPLLRFKWVGGQSFNRFTALHVEWLLQGQR